MISGLNCGCFFFSSRRRHTRCGRDWSSDVCSSDLFVRFGDNIQADQAAARGQQTAGNRLDQIAIEELDLSVRAFNCLKANDITTVGQLLTKKEDELLSLRNFGRKSLDEIKETLVEKGFVEPDQMATVFR